MSSSFQQNIVFRFHLDLEKSIIECVYELRAAKLKQLILSFSAAPTPQFLCIDPISLEHDVFDEPSIILTPSNSLGILMSASIIVKKPVSQCHIIEKQGLRNSLTLIALGLVENKFVCFSFCDLLPDGLPHGPDSSLLSFLAYDCTETTLEYFYAQVIKRHFEHIIQPIYYIDDIVQSQQIALNTFGTHLG